MWNGLGKCEISENTTNKPGGPEGFHSNNGPVQSTPPTVRLTRSYQRLLKLSHCTLHCQNEAKGEQAMQVLGYPWIDLPPLVTRLRIRCCPPLGPANIGQCLSIFWYSLDKMRLIFPRHGPFNISSTFMGARPSLKKTGVM